jgi:hypothetical protein
MKIITANKINEIQIEKAFENVVNGRGLIVSVYQKHAALLCEASTPEQGAGAENKFSFAFHTHNDGIRWNLHTRTDGKTREDALENIKNRVIETINEKECVEFYYFETLREFAAAVIANNWF